MVGSAPYADEYTARVHELADERVRFLGGVWDQDLLDQLYANSVTYLHGHSVGGTNPSLLAEDAPAHTRARARRAQRGAYRYDWDDVATRYDNPRVHVIVGRLDDGAADRRGSFNAPLGYEAGERVGVSLRGRIKGAGGRSDFRRLRDQHREYPTQLLGSPEGQGGNGHRPLVRHSTPESGTRTVAAAHCLVCAIIAISPDFTSTRPGPVG